MRQADISKKLFLSLFPAVLLISCLFGVSVPVFAADAVFTNPQTGYQAFIDDREDILTDEEEKLLIADMIKITEYGGVAFVSDRYAEARGVYRQYFGTDSGTILLIDMGSRVITIFSDGRIYKTVNKKYGSIITDNIYKYASKGDYYLCATRAFTEEYTLLEGGKIAQPMRHITNAMTAVVLALIGNFMYVWIRKKRISGETIAKTVMILSAADTVSKAPLAKNLISSRQSRSSSDSGGGGSSGGGGGFGGGGSSGGGGSHRF